MEKPKTPEEILERYSLILYRSSIHYKDIQQILIEFYKEYASKFTSANEGSVVVTDEDIFKESVKIATYFVIPENGATESNLQESKDWFRMGFQTGAKWVRDQYENGKGVI